MSPLSPMPATPARFTAIEPLTDTPLERTLRAHDTVLQRDVMIKLPARHAVETWSAKVTDRLLREARAVAKIRHDGIAPIHWVEETAEGPLLVLDLPEGETLAERLERGPLDPDETIALGIAVGDALAQVHYHGIVHRCIGPTSIRYLPNGRVQLGEFTFAKQFGTRREVSSLDHGKRAQPDLGKQLPDYSAPEQLAGQAADARADIFALGCTLYRCLTGREGFEPGAEHQPLPDVRKLRPEASRKLAQVITKCAMPAKISRYETAQQVVEALKALQGGTDNGRSRRIGSLATVASALVAIALLLAFGPKLWSTAPSPRGEPRGEALDNRYQSTYGPDYAHVYGLFIGIAEGYAGTDWPVLENPVREVTAVTEQLKANDPKWEATGAIRIVTDFDATYDRIEQELDDIVRVAEQEDAVLIYFAGHGVKVGRSFGLCGADAEGRLGNGTGYLRREVLGTYLDNLKAKHVLVVLDCCHSSAVFEVAATRGRDPDLLKPIDIDPGAHHRKNFSREFLCSAAADEMASDGTDMSPFAKLFLHHLRQPADETRQYVAARYLSAHIADVMDQRVARSARVQVPKFKQMSEQEGSFVFKLAKGQ